MAQAPRVILYGRPEIASFGAFAEGLASEGFRPVFQRPGLFKSRDADPSAVAVVVNGLKGEALVIADTYRALGIPVWVMELPRLRNEPDAFSLLYGSLHWLPLPNDRPVVAAPVIEKRSPEVTLVAAQKERDASHGMDPKQLEEFLRITIADARAAHPSRPVAIRPHPRSELEVPADWWGADELSVGDVRDALARSACVVTYNSTVGWDAIAAGVPVVALAGHANCAYWPYTARLDEVKPLPARKRTEALKRAAAGQWTLAEMASGAAVRATVADSSLTFDPAVAA